MPVIGTFHTFYWGDPTAGGAPPTVTSGTGGYPAWQVGVSGWLWVCAACLSWLRRGV